MAIEVNKTITKAYVDIRGACDYCSLSRRTLDYAKSRGELPYIKKGAKILFLIDDLDQWMQRDRIDATAV